MDYETIRDTQFTKETIHVDGKQFVGCTFHGCDLVYSGGEPFAFVQSELRGADIMFVGAAANVLNALANLHHTGMHEYVEQVFERIRNPMQSSTQ